MPNMVDQPVHRCRQPHDGLTIEDLSEANYTVELYYDICQNMMGCDGDSGEFAFTATAETMSETFHLETDNYTCNVNINVHLYEEMDGWNSHVAHDYFYFNGPASSPLAIHSDIRRRRVGGQ